MCGIAGCVGPDPRAGQVLDEALTAIVHRGPDDVGVHVMGDVAMGMRRLSIIDLAGGRQPISNEDGTITVVFNGEIYNYVELRQDLLSRGHVLRTESDTECLVHLYEDFGLDFPRRLRGMFAFAIHDTRTERVVLGRDRFGKKPLHYAQWGRQLAFGSELKALLPFAQALGHDLRVSDRSVYDYLSFGVVPQPRTIYESVSVLPPASVGVWDGRSFDVRPYWEPTFHPKAHLSTRDAQAEVRRLLRESVELRLRSDVPVGVFLSGGVDSSVIAYEAAAQRGDTVHCFTVSTGGALDESDVAKRTAQRLGVRHTVLPLAVDPLAGITTVVEHYDQPFADSSAIPSLLVARAAAEHVKVVLNGDGGDEIFAGYRRHVAAAQLGRFSRVPTSVAAAAAQWLTPMARGRRSPAGLAARFARGLAMTPEDRYLAWTTDMLRDSDKQSVWLRGPQPPTEAAIAATLRPELSALDQQLYSDVKLNLLSDLLVKMDMACMARSLEGRSPLLDHELAEFVFGLPDAMRVTPRTPKALLRSSYAGLLNDEVIHGAKRGFEVPMAGWLAGELRPLVHDVLLTPSARVNSYIEADTVTRLFAGSAFGERNRAYLQYALLVLELWLRRLPGQ